MNADFNVYNVVREFERILEENVQFEKDCPITYADTLVAEFLARTFAHYTCKYVLNDEDEDIEDGGISQL